MPIEINEMVTDVSVSDNASILEPNTLQAIVKAVMAAMKEAQVHGVTRESDLDTRSIVDQQRGGKR
jgi:hypothetical protein